MENPEFERIARAPWGRRPRTPLTPRTSESGRPVMTRVRDLDHLLALESRIERAYPRYQLLYYVQNQASSEPLLPGIYRGRPGFTELGKRFDVLMANARRLSQHIEGADDEFVNPNAFQLWALLESISACPTPVVRLSLSLDRAFERAYDFGDRTLLEGDRNGSVRHGGGLWVESPRIHVLAFRYDAAKIKPIGGLRLECISTSFARRLGVDSAEGDIFAGYYQRPGLLACQDLRCFDFSCRRLAVIELPEPEREGFKVVSDVPPEHLEEARQVC